MGKDQLDHLELDGIIALRIMGGIAWNCKVRRLNLQLLPGNPYGKAGNEEKIPTPIYARYYNAIHFLVRID